MPGMWIDGMFSPGVAEEAAKLGEDAAVYFFISALIYDLSKLEDDFDPQKLKDTNFFNAVGVLGEIPIHATDHLEAVITQLVPTLEKCIADGTISLNISIDILANALLSGLEFGFISEHARETEEFPWFEGQRQIAEVLRQAATTN